MMRWLFLPLVASLSTPAGLPRVVETPAAPPIGHVEFCKRLPDECRMTFEAAPLPLTGDLVRLLRQVNLDVNTTVMPMLDKVHHAPLDEVWQFPDEGWGDCEDFALEKRRRLNAAGIPLSNLLMTFVTGPMGGHAILTVRTDRGFFLLDNLRDDIIHWTASDYQFRARQSVADARRWVKYLE